MGGEKDRQIDRQTENDIDLKCWYGNVYLHAHLGK